MEEFRKGLGWLLFGILLVLTSLGGALHVARYFWLTPDTLRWAGLICGAVGISYLYLGDFSRFRNQDGRNGRN